jgi:hypothetical protein
VVGAVVLARRPPRSDERSPVLDEPDRVVR